MKSDFLRNDNEQQETRETEEKKASLHLNDFAVTKMAFGWAPTYLALFLLIRTSSANTVNTAIDNGSNRPIFATRRRFFTAPIGCTV